MDPKDTITASIQTLQESIKNLSNLIQQPGADIPGINNHIRLLIAKQTDLRTLELQQDLDEASNQAAINALTNAARNLTGAAGKIKNVATACDDATQVINAASSLITALSPFLGVA